MNDLAVTGDVITRRWLVRRLAGLDAVLLLLRRLAGLDAFLLLLRCELVLAGWRQVGGSDRWAAGWWRRGARFAVPIS